MRKAVWLTITALLILAAYSGLKGLSPGDKAPPAQSEVDVSSPSLKPDTLSPSIAAEPVAQSAASATTSSSRVLTSPSEVMPSPHDATHPKRELVRSRSRATVSATQETAVDDADVLETRETEPDERGHFQRTSLTRTKLKYPLVRTEETVEQAVALQHPHTVAEKSMVGDHVLVKVQPGTTDQEVEGLAAKYGGHIRKKMYAPNMWIIAFSNATLDTVPSAMQALSAEPTVVYSEPDYLARPLVSTPNDTDFGRLWALHNTGQDFGVPDADIDAPEAWDLSIGSSNVLVAVIDTGIDYTHTDLCANIWINPGEAGPLSTNTLDDDGNGFVNDFRGWDFYNDDNDPMDDNGHGTHCAGTIGAVGNNVTGVVGVCWQVSLVGLKVFSSEGTVIEPGVVSDAIDATYYATRLGAKVLSNSWGVDDYSQGLRDAIRDAETNGVLYVAAAGNDGEDTDATPEYPASYTNANVVAVASSDRHDELSDFSNYGAGSVDLAAPGSDILSTVPGDAYGLKSGTSMATPHVAGAAALLLAHNSSLSPLELKNALLSNVDTNSAFAGKMVSGGRLNIDRAIRNVSGLYFDQRQYFTRSWAAVTLVDTSLQGTATQTVELSSTAGDSESLVLVEQVDCGGHFTNAIWIAHSAVATNSNGQLEAIHGSVLTATYTNGPLGITNTDRAAVNHQLHITITTPPHEVSAETTHVAVSGLNNGNVHVDMVVSNEATADTALFTATNSWTSPAVTIAQGANRIWVLGTNAHGFADSDFVTITRVGPSAATNYVSLAGSHVWPFTSWGTAATNIQDAIDAAYDGNVVLVSNGAYHVRSQVLLDRGITLRGAFGRTNTVIDADGSNRCVYVSHAQAAVEGFTIREGSASEGAGVYLYGGGTLADCLVTACETNGVYCFFGGVVTNCSILQNTAEIGGGVYLYRGGSLTESAIESNQAKYYGGGVYIEREGRLSHCHVNGNDVVDGVGGYLLEHGGGVFCEEGGTIADSTLEDNEADFGGGVYCYLGGTVTNCLIAENDGVKGGGIYIDGPGNLHDSEIVSNRAFSGYFDYDSYGGGVYASAGALVDGCRISNNEADGGYYDCDGNGGGAYVNDSTLRNCLVSKNEVYAGNGESYGAGVYCVGGTVESCTITDNTLDGWNMDGWADGDGGGIYASSASLMVNTIVHKNIRDDSEGSISDVSGSVTARHSCASDLPPGDGNVVADPMFLDWAAGNYRLLPASPCIDAGTNQAWMADASDLDGNKRIGSGTVDMGCYESGEALDCYLIADPESATAPVDVQFTAYVTGTNKTGLFYRWDFENDGTNEWEGFGLAVRTNTYATPGTYSVLLTVSNAAGEIATCIRTNYVTVQELTHFSFAPITSPQASGESFPVTITARDSSNNTATAFTDSVSLRCMGPGGDAVLVPTNTAAFTEGVWSGSVTVNSIGTNLYLVAEDSMSHSGTSGVFDVDAGPLDHFSFGAIGSTQHVNVAFPVSITAEDQNGYVVLDFTNSVDLRLLPGGEENEVLGLVPHSATYSSVNSTRGLRFTPDVDITIVGFARYWGDKVTLWTDDGTLIASENLPGAEKSWVEMSMERPITLSASNTYRLACYRSSGGWFTAYGLTNACPFAFSNGVVHSSCWGSGDAFPSTTLAGDRYLVDMRYIAGATTPDALFPLQTTSFENGTWAGDVIVKTVSSHARLRARDSSQHVGYSSPFGVHSLGNLLLSVPASATEGDGLLANQGLVGLSGIPVSNVTVYLESDDTSEVVVSNTVVVPAGQTNATFDLTIMEDPDLDLSQSATITAWAAGYPAVSQSIAVYDNETATLSIHLPASAAEGDGILDEAGMVTVETAPTVDVDVGLTSDDTSEVVVTNLVTIPAGQTNVAFDLVIVDDVVTDLTQTATITAHVDGWTDGSNTIDVLDDESLVDLVVASPFGAVRPDRGTNTYYTGTNLACEVLDSPVAHGVDTQYVCTGWTGTGSVPSNGLGTNVTFALTNDSSIAWNWKTQFTFAATSAGSGSVAVSNGWYDAGAEATATAVPSNGYHFAYWSGDIPATHASSNPVSLLMDRPREITAHFGANTNEYALIVSSAHGSVLPVPGTNIIAYTSNLTDCAVLDSPVADGVATQYVCTGWTGAGSVPPAGDATNVSFVLTRDSTIAWTWKTQFLFTASAGENGTVAATNGWYDFGTEAAATAEPDEGYRFGGWIGDIPADKNDDNPLTLTVDRAYSVTSAFVTNVIYVSNDGSNVFPYATWQTAATNITEAVSHAPEGCMVVVTDGVYTISSQISLSEGVTLKSVNGAQATTVDAQGDCRCIYMTHSNTVVEGFTLTRGYFYGNGGGVYMTGGEVRSCVVSNNSVSGGTYSPARYGGGVYMTGGVVSDCEIRNNCNSGSVYENGFGGGVYVAGPGLLLRCVLADNTAKGGDTWSGYGGGAYVAGGACLNHCLITGNAAQPRYAWGFGYGGGVYCSEGQIANCTVVGNATYVGGYSDPPVGGGVMGGSVHNCIVYFNTGGNISGGTCAYTCSDPARTGEGNIGDEPLFADKDNGDYHLKSRIGRYTTNGVWVTDVVHSPCIDAGDPGSDWTSEPEPNGGRINMGYYGNTPEASKCMRTLTVVSDHGTTDPLPGVYVYQANTQLTCRAGETPVIVGDTNYDCIGWAGMGDVTNGVGTNVTFTLETWAWVTWLWQTNYSLDLTVAPGTVDVTNGWYAADTELLATVDVPEGHELAYWSGTTGGCVAAGNQITIPMDQPRSLAAHYIRGFYINDGSTNLDAWCTQPGDDANDGLSPSRPKLTVQSLLATNSLAPGDVVRIDTGTYVLDSNITVGSDDEGASGQPVIFEASPFGVTFDRSNTVSTAYGWHFDHCDYVTLRTATITNSHAAPQRWMQVVGGYYGVRLYHANYCALERVEVASNANDGIYGYESDRIAYSNCLVHSNSDDGMYLVSCDYNTLANCTVAGNGGDELNGDDYSTDYLKVRNSILVADGTGDYAVRLYYASDALDWDYNCLAALDGAHVAEANGDLPTLADWQAASGEDAHSISVDPAFVNPISGDYHLMSTTGSYHQGTWAADAASSLAIDMGYGDEGDEPEPSKTGSAPPNLGRRNLGAYGGTEQGSKTPEQRRLELLEPVGGEIYSTQVDPVEISWRRFGAGWGSDDTLLLEYSANSGSTWTGIPGAGSEIATNSVYSWDISSLTPGPLYRVRITCNQEPGVADESAGDFRIGEFLVFYANDASTTNDNWCSAPGSDVNNGLTPATPKAGVQAILDTYDLEPGDVVRIDTGTYTPTSNIAVGPADGGSSEHPVAFEASPYGVTVDRGTNTAGSYGWHTMSGADYVTLRTVTSTQHTDVAQSWMKITGGYYGLYVDGSYSAISRVQAADNPDRGMYIDGQHCRVENCLMHGSTNSAAGTGLYVGSDGDYLSVSNCTITGNGKYGVYLGSASSVVLRNNIIVVDGTTAYGVYRSSTGYSLDSDFNSLFATNGAHVGFSGGDRATLLDWQQATAGDANSIGVDPGFVNPTSGDYHLISTTGSYHEGTWAADPTSSLAIDAGCGEVGDEPEPNQTAWAGVGVGRRNLGAYGGTEQGSKTPEERLLLRLIEPVGGETYVAQTNPVAVSWAWTGGGWQSNDTALIECSSVSGLSWSGIPGADSVPLTNGVYSWDISGLSPGPLYRVRITCNQESALTDQSAEDFRIGKFLTFYVNNGSTNLDNWCTQPGDDLNSGVAPEMPKACVQAILDTYDLEPGDVVRIDTGSYTNSGNIDVTSDDEGSSTDSVVFEASPYGVQIDRNNTGSGNYGWHLNHCDYVTLRTATSTSHPAATQSWMRIAGGYYGLYVYNANYCTVARVEVCSNAVDGVYGYYGYRTTYSNCLVRANGDDGCELDYCDYNRLENCTIAGNSDDQIDADDYSTDYLTVRNSILVADGEGDFAVRAYYTSDIVDWDYNCLVAINGAQVGEVSGARPTLPDWQAATGGDANSTNAWPEFAASESSDYHLMSVEGRYAGGSMWVTDTHHSPCIDAGDPAAAWTNEPPANGGRLNMGAYGNTEQASKSPTNTVWTLQVVSDHGSATPPVGTYTYYENSLVDCGVTPEEIVGNTRYVCDGWTLGGQGDTNGQFSGSSPDTGLILTNHALLTWVWSTNDWVDHYVWDSIGATQYLHEPFPVRVSVQDAHGVVVTGYSGTASISGWFDAEATNTVYGTASHSSSSSSTYTRGIRITPSSDLTVTHARHYWGGKVSIWRDDGTLLASRTVTSTPGTWVESPLDEPVVLLGGETYRIGAYYVSGSSTYYYHYNDCPFAFPNGTVLSSCYASGDAFPSTLRTSDRYFADVVYTAGPFDSASISPTNTGSFIAGVWTGEVAVLDAGSNAYLHAEDANERDGSSSTFDVLANAPMGTSILWLRQHGLTNGPCYLVELQNPDGDPMLTWEEYIADTIPTNGNSFLAITGISDYVDGIRVMWKGGTNAWQCLQTREDLMATGEQWLAVFTNVPPTPGTTNYLHQSVTNRVLYYRLKAWR